jgi:hypothetical protein
MTVEQWLARALELVRGHDQQLLAGEITASQADAEERELVMRARIDLSDEDGLEFLNGILRIHQALATELAQGGYPVSGNDPKKPN